MKRISEGRTTRKVYESEVEGRRAVCLLLTGCLNRVKKTCSAGSIELSDEEVNSVDE